CTLNRGTSSSGKTLIGSGCLLMAYVHVAHDCRVGNRVILANNATLAGHVEVEDEASIGGLTAVHQFTRIGRQSFIGGMSRVTQDVPPYCRAAGAPLRLYGLNEVGLVRRKLPAAGLSELKSLYRLFFRSRLLRADIVVKLKSMKIESEAGRDFVDFILNRSKRGVVSGSAVDKKRVRE
ncbi:MAG TPA: acyl-[acyl-carrier-protein]--UDP-N-acetylglucosamine O-acyltransferase, partial [bacterium]|nr:acyl-[acyl-carrier-protein]--UDP-N-acetylglucosamine O-acyltransferase [bacterium]